MKYAYRIIDWGTAHCLAETKRQKHLQWVPFPVKEPSESLAWLWAQPGGWAAFGVYCALVELGGTMEVRGLFATRVRPMAVEDIASKLEANRKDIAKALKILTFVPPLATAGGQPHPWRPYLDRVGFPVADELVEVTTVRDEVRSRTIRALPLGPNDQQSQDGEDERLAERSAKRATERLPKRARGEEKRGEEKTDPRAGERADPRSSAIAAFERLLGHGIGVGQISQLDRFAATLPPLVAIGDGEHDRYALIDRACGDALGRGSVPDSVNGGLKLLREICERCIRDGRWPGDFRARERAASIVKLGVARAG